MKLSQILSLGLLLLIFPLMQACVDPDGGTDNMFTSSERYNATLATVITPSTFPGEAVIENDDNQHQYVVNPDLLTLKNVNRQGQRIFYNYVMAESPKGTADSRAPYIKITDLMPVLTKKIEIDNETDENNYGADGIYISSHSLGKKYLTIQFQIMVSDANIKHRISLTVRPDAAPDADGYLPLELRHNSEGDVPKSISQPGYVSFLLTEAPGYEEGSLKGLHITYRSLSGEETHLKIAYTASKAAAPFQPMTDFYGVQVPIQ